MPQQTSSKCKICMSGYRVEIENLRAKDKIPLEEIAKTLKTKYGFHIDPSAIHRHMRNHFNYDHDALTVTEQESKLIFQEQLFDVETRAKKLTGMMQASYEYIQAHWKELDLKTAVQIFFSSADQVQKMQIAGMFASNDFVMQFLEMVNQIKAEQHKQAKLPTIYEATPEGDALLVKTITEPAQEEQNK